MFNHYVQATIVDLIFQEVSKQGTAVEKLKSGLPKFDKAIQECEVLLVLRLTCWFFQHQEVIEFVTFCLKERISDIEQQVTAVESEMTKIQTEAEFLGTEQQHIVAELQNRKKTVKDKQVYWRGLPVCFFMKRLKCTWCDVFSLSSTCISITREFSCS